MATDKPIKGSNAGEIDVEKAVFAQVPWSLANRGVTPNQLINMALSMGIDVTKWTRSSWSTATGSLAASWARSSWSCTDCDSLGGVMDPTRSSWSRSSWSSAGESAAPEAAGYVTTTPDQPDDPSLTNLPIPTDPAVAP
jgi:serine protease AprX